MNEYDLKKMLCDTPEASVTVSDNLHRDIMRKVRLTESVNRRSRSAWVGPTLGSAMAVLLLAVLHFSQSGSVQTQQPLAIAKIDRPTILQVFGDSLKGIKDESLLTENELKLELERFKSDLKRFDFRS